MSTNRDARDGNWTKPGELPLPPQAQNQPSAGDAAILVLHDSSRPAAGALEATVLAALGHMGMPYVLWDLAAGALPEAVARGHALIVLAQEDLGPSLTAASAGAAVAALEDGIGLVSLDPALGAYPQALRDRLGLQAGRTGETDGVRFPSGGHFIRAWRDDAETVTFRKAVPYQELGGNGDAVLLTGNGKGAILRAGTAGRGRFAWLGLSPRVWLPDSLGHAWGLDDIFWRSLVWAARKPFVMKAMPPFRTMRFDDCSGFGSLWWIIGHANSLNIPHPEPLKRIINRQFGGQASVLRHFDYVAALNEFDWRAETSLFMENVPEEDWPHLKRLHDQGGVQVSVHSFADGYDEHGTWYSRIITHRGVEVLTDKGTEFRYSLAPADVTGFLQTHDARRTPYRIARFSDAELEANFARLDAIWQRRGITPGVTHNMHWRNMPSNALAFAKRRGQVLSMCSTRCNYVHADPEAFLWRKLPYGNGGMFLDYLPIPEDATGVAPTDFFQVVSHVRSLSADDPFQDSADISRCRKPAIPGLCTHRDLDLMAESMVRETKLGLQSLFFACPMTHEMNLATLTGDEWRGVLRAVEKGLARYPTMPALYDEIAMAARSKCETHIARARRDHGRVTLELTGTAQSPVWLYVFTDGAEGCDQRLEKAAPFTGSTTLALA